MKSFPQVSHIAAGATAVVVGYSSAVVLVIQAAQAAGATPDMVVSWLLALGLGMGVSCILYSWLYKVPVVTAWSTPGAAFLIGNVQGFSINEVVGSFLIAAALSLVTAQNKWLSNAINRIPAAVSSALLAGIILPICLGIFTDSGEHPLLLTSFLALFLFGSRWFPRYMMLALLTLALVTSVYLGEFSQVSDGIAWPTAVWVTPAFSLSATISVALPLYLITMLSQNLPGLAILKSHDYAPNTRAVLSGLSVIQAITAPFGGFSFNLAAITAAICMGENAGHDRNQRYWAAIMAGVGYLILAALAALVVVVFVNMPAIIIHLLAGIALLSTLQGALFKAMDDTHYRGAALITLVCSASGMTLWNLSAPVWGLLLGLIWSAFSKK